MARVGCSYLLKSYIYRCNVRSSVYVRFVAQCFRVSMNRYVILNGVDNIRTKSGCLMHGWLFKYGNDACRKMVLFTAGLKAISIDLNGVITVYRMSYFTGSDPIYNYEVMHDKIVFTVHVSAYVTNVFEFALDSVKVRHRHFITNYELHAPIEGDISGLFGQDIYRSFNIAIRFVCSAKVCLHTTY